MADPTAIGLSETEAASRALVFGSNEPLLLKKQALVLKIPPALREPARGDPAPLERRVGHPRRLHQRGDHHHDRRPQRTRGVRADAPVGARSRRTEGPGRADRHRAARRSVARDPRPHARPWRRHPALCRRHGPGGRAAPRRQGPPRQRGGADGGVAARREGSGRARPRFRPTVRHRRQVRARCSWVRPS